MKDILKSIKIFDVPIFLIILFLTVFSFFYLYGVRDTSYNVVVKYSEEEWIYPLEIDRNIEVQGKIGITKLKIENGEVTVVDSPCPNKTCVASPPLKKVGDWTACLPNQVFLYIKEAR